MQVKHAVIGALALLSMCGTVATTTQPAHAAYSDFDSSNGRTKLSYRQAKKRWKHVHKLAFFENESSDSTDTTYYALGYYVHGKLYQYTLDSNNDAWQEIVDPNLKTPYVVINNNDNNNNRAFGRDTVIAIHRPPYNMYNQPAVSGKVTAKDGE